MRNPKSWLNGVFGSRPIAKAMAALTGKVSKDVERRFLKAVYEASYKDVKIYLGRGVDPNIFFEELLVAPLHMAAENGDINLGRLLLNNNKININLRTGIGYSPLHLSCLFNKQGFARFLLEHGANPNIKDGLDKTPLHSCCCSGTYQIIIDLLEFKADLNAMDCFQRTPLTMVLIDNHSLVAARMLISAGANLHDERRHLHIFFECILQCINRGYMDYVTLLLDKGIDINMRDKNTNRNCLHFVAISGYLPLAVSLVERGADKTALDVLKMTPLQIARRHQNHFVADYFMKGYRPPNLLRVLMVIKKWKRLAHEKALRRMREEAANKDNKNNPI